MWHTIKRRQWQRQWDYTYHFARCELGSVTGVEREGERDKGRKENTVNKCNLDARSMAFVKN